MLHLPDVTLCTVTTVNHELSVRAINECLRHCSFGDVVMISDQSVEAPFRVEIMPPFASGWEYAPFICQKLTNYTSTAFNLLVQYDGYVCDPAAWTDEFLDYDYIGPKWPWHRENRRVGNSGFCLRSKKLLDILAETPLPPTGEFVDDIFICHAMREPLEKNYGIRIGTEEIADKFAYERHVPNAPSFGFHGMFNFWRHVDDTEMEKIPALLNDHYLSSRAYVEVLFEYHKMRKFSVFASWYMRMRDLLDHAKMREHLLSFVDKPDFIDELISLGEMTTGLYRPATSDGKAA